MNSFWWPGIPVYSWNDPNSEALTASVLLPGMTVDYGAAAVQFYGKGEGQAVLCQHSGIFYPRNTMVRRGNGQLVNQKYYYPRHPSGRN